MDRPTTRPDADNPDVTTRPEDPTILPSRRTAFESCRSTAGSLGTAKGGRSDAAGPVLLTGEAGVGKTWLWRQVEAKAPTGFRWVTVDLTPSEDPADFYRLIAHELGLGEPTASRVELLDALAGLRADGLRVGLVVEEAHNLGFDLWEEVRILANRLGRPGGFAAMLLIGQTPLALRFKTRPFAAIEARLSARVHLGPITVAEAGQLLAQVRPRQVWANDEIELLHRDAAGNPGRLLRLASVGLEVPELVEARPTPPAIEQKPAPVAAPVVVAERPIAPKHPATVASAPTTEISKPAPLTGPAKPPILFEENMIEVGWAADEAASPTSQRSRGSAEAPSVGNEESVQDHYAALQAWREWAENQARRSASTADFEEEEVEEEEDDLIEPDEIEPIPPERPIIRAEGEQKFAPFGQLFSKMAQAREPE